MTKPILDVAISKDTQEVKYEALDQSLNIIVSHCDKKTTSHASI